MLQVLSLGETTASDNKIEFWRTGNIGIPSQNGKDNSMQVGKLQFSKIFL